MKTLKDIKNVAGQYGLSANVAPNHGDSFNVPYFEVPASDLKEMIRTDFDSLELPDVKIMIDDLSKEEIEKEIENLP